MGSLSGFADWPSGGFGIGDAAASPNGPGIVRPEDIESDNTIDSSKIAQARFAYGGRGQITEMQQNRYGEQIYSCLPRRFRTARAQTASTTRPPAAPLPEAAIFSGAQ